MVLSSVAEARLQREVQYYARCLSQLQRREDAAVWRGLQEARDAPNAEQRRDAIVHAMRVDTAENRAGVRGFYRNDDEAAGQWVGAPAPVRAGVGSVYRGIDDDNRGSGTCNQRTLGFFAAFCPAQWPELSGRGGDAWTLPSECTPDDYDAMLARLHSRKATSLDRVSKEMLEAASPAFRRACFAAAMEVATPDACGNRHKPSIWQRIPVNLINKKKATRVIRKKRDIGLPSQLLKLQAALYFPAYEGIMPRLLGVNHGWTRGMAARGAAMVGGYALDHALLLRHRLIAVYGDIQRFFPAMDRDFVLASEAWYGLPRDVREATLALYRDACMQYETEHGLADFVFETLHMTTGFIQGCLLSTEKAKLFINSLAEAINTLIAAGGVRFWNGQRGGGCREPSTFCADDLLGMVTSWEAAAAFVAVLDEWAGVSASRFGIDQFAKTTYSALDVGDDGVPREAVAPPGFAPTIHGTPVPRLPIDVSYPHIGDPRRMNGDQSEARDKVSQLCHGWLARVDRMGRCNQREFAEITNGGFGAIVEAYAHCAPLTFADGDHIEKARRRLFKRRFRGVATVYTADRYLPAPWQPEPRFGAVTEEVHEASMVGDGWYHVAAYAAAGLHAATVSALADGIDSQLRRCARSILELTCFLWGMRGDSAITWTWDHLETVLARRTGATRSSVAARIYPMEMYMLNHVRTRALMQGSERIARLGVGDAIYPRWNFRVEVGHEPPPGDPFDLHAPHRQLLSDDRMELFRGELVSTRVAARLGRVREPCWLLLSCGVVMRSHACRRDGSGYMSFPEATRAIPALVRRFSHARARNAWRQLVADLTTLQIPAVAGEAVVDAYAVWRGDGSADGSEDVQLGDRGPLESLLARLAAGDVASADAWANAYRTWRRDCAPRAPEERPLPMPTPAERAGPHVRYYLPPKDGVREELVRGGPSPSRGAADARRLARYAAQWWRVADDGRSICCAAGTSLADASVVTRLFARALPIAVEAFDAAQAAKRRKRSKVVHACAVKGVAPPPEVLTDEEKSWDGGPGFNAALANLTLHELLRVEQMQGYAFDAACVGDGSWDKQQRLVSRAALLDDGTVLGGPVDVDDVIAGDRNNYDGEMAHRIDVLAHVHEARLLYIFDSTSPVTAAERFRRSTLPVRASFQCDDWLGSGMAYEQRQQVVVYWWSKSHRGHLPEAAADALAKKHLQGHFVPVPVTYSRHASLSGYAKDSERAMALEAARLSIIRRELTLGDGLRATRRDYDALRAAQLCERDCLQIRRLRSDHARLQVSRAYPNNGPQSVGALLSAAGCPCGHGPQDRHHLLWHCQLCGVVAERSKMVDACEALGHALAACEPVHGEHQVNTICLNALRNGVAPRAGTYHSVGGDVAQAALAHMLGLVRRPDDDRRLRRALRPTGPVLRSVAAMLRIAEAESAKATAAVVARHLSRQRLDAGFSWLRFRALVSPRAPEAHTPAPQRQRLEARQRQMAPTAIVVRHTSRHWQRPLPGQIVSAALAPTLRHAASAIRGALIESRGDERWARLRALDAQLARIVEAPVVAARNDAAVADIIADTFASSDAFPDDELHSQLQAERDRTARAARAAQLAHDAGSAREGVARWATWWPEQRAFTARVARRAAAAALLPPPPAAPPLTAAQRRDAAAHTAQLERDEGVAVVLLHAHPVLAQAAAAAAAAGRAIAAWRGGRRAASSAAAPVPPPPPAAPPAAPAARGVRRPRPDDAADPGRRVRAVGAGAVPVAGGGAAAAVALRLWGGGDGTGAAHAGAVTLSLSGDGGGHHALP